MSQEENNSEELKESGSQGETSNADTPSPQLPHSQPPSLPDSPTPPRGSIWLLRTGVQAATVVIVAALVFFLLGVAQRTKWLTADGFSGGRSESVAEAGDGEPKRYICPMMCTPPSTEPGRCPVCAMELVAATGGGGGDGISVTIESSARRLVGIQTALSKLGEVNRTIRTIGSIDFDESRLSTISAYVDGRLEKMYANYAGVQVREGDDLALIYSPQLYTAQTEFSTSLNSGGKIGRFEIDGGDLNEMARENLAELGMTQAQIDELAKSGKPQSRIRIKSPQSGTVIEKSAVEGDYVETGHTLYRVADLSSVWLMLDLFPDDASAVRFGQQVEAEIQSMPGEVFTGRVAFIDPTVNAKTRTVRVRVEIMNFDGKLRPGDYATARVTVPAIPMNQVYDPALANKYISPMHPQVIRDEPGQCPLCDMDLVPTSQLGFAAAPLPMQQVVTVPRDAVLLAGENSVIYVETEPGRFEIRRVTVGPMNRKEAVIVEGLAAGETVATGGNFLIDSQMQLAGNPSLMDPSKAPRYSPGPLQLPQSTPILLASDAGGALDRTYDAYFAIQVAMAADQTPPPVALNSLIQGLRQLEMSASVPDEAQRRFATARRAASRMDGSLETAREAYRGVSHALLRAATVARGPQTARSLYHMYCPMVPGGGGDWMQANEKLANPYWGSQMLRCGELVGEMGSGGVREMGSLGDGESGSWGDGESWCRGTRGKCRRLEMSDRINSHRDLIVYQKSFAAGKRIFELSKSFPRETMYSLTDQVRRSSRSVSANIAEAWRKRRYEKHLCSTLNIAEAEAAETQVWLDYATAHGYLDEKTAAKANDYYEEILRIIVKMIYGSSHWCSFERKGDGGPESRGTREQGSGYQTDDGFPVIDQLGLLSQTPDLPDSPSPEEEDKDA